MRRELSRNDDSDDSDDDTGTSPRCRRPRERRRRRRRTSCSASCRRKCKWAFNKCVSEENLRKASCYELISTMAEWVLDRKDMSVQDYQAVFEHVSFLTELAKYNEFNDIAHIDYDLAIQRLALKQGFAAFGMANQRVSVRFYVS